MIESTTDLRKMLLEEIQLIRNGEADFARATAISKLTSQVISSVKLDIDIVALRAKTPDTAVDFDTRLAIEHKK